jgi:transcriptional regulator with XRE-family HTH domain
MSPKRGVNSVDKHVGSRLRARRLSLGMSQEKIGRAVNLTFQQIQKYEKGTNRVGASRLMQFSVILGVPPAYFFEDAPAPEGVGRAKGLATTDRTAERITEFLASNDGTAIVMAALQLDPRTLRIARQFIEGLASANAPRKQ